MCVVFQQANSSSPIPGSHLMTTAVDEDLEMKQCVFHSFCSRIGYDFSSMNDLLGPFPGSEQYVRACSLVS